MALRTYDQAFPSSFSGSVSNNVRRLAEYGLRRTTSALQRSLRNQMQRNLDARVPPTSANRINSRDSRVTRSNYRNSNMVARTNRRGGSRRGNARPRKKARSGASSGRSRPSIGGDSMARSVKGKKRKLGKKPIKVSAKFRKKVLKAVQSKEPYGYVEELFAKKLSAAVDNAQVVANLFDGVSNQTGTLPSEQGQYFSPTDLLHYASSCFNSKAFSSTVRTLTDAGNFGLATGTFDILPSVKIFVRNWYVQHKIKNNSNIGKYVNIFECTAKKPGDQYAYTHWVNDMVALYNSRIINTSTNIDFIGMSPAVSDNFKQYFDIKTTKTYINAGETFSYSVQGPQQKMYDYQKLRNADTFPMVTKGMKFVLVAFWNEPVVTTLSTVGYYTDVITTSPYALLVETKNVCTFSMPEQAGILIDVALPAPGTTAGKPLNQRYTRKFFKNYVAAQSGVILNMEEENPIDVSQPLG